MCNCLSQQKFRADRKLIACQLQMWHNTSFLAFTVPCLPILPRAYLVLALWVCYPCKILRRCLRRSLHPRCGLLPFFFSFFLSDLAQIVPKHDKRCSGSPICEAPKQITCHSGEYNSDLFFSQCVARKMRSRSHANGHGRRKK